MAGVGATLMAALMGRNVVLVELEPHFVAPLLASWRKMQVHGPMLGETMGQVLILRGDARRLPLGSADSIITSPPYEGSVSDGREVIGSLDASKSPRWEPGPNSQVNGHQSYTRPQSLPRPCVQARGDEHGVDAVIQSPPFQDQTAAQDPTWLEEHRQEFSKNSWTDMIGPALRAGILQKTSENIGNLRNTAYWEAMRQVYAECWRVLRPGGIMALVLKGFTRDGKYVDLPGQTEALLLAAGWVEHDRWRRELWSLSFWRILQKRRDPASFDDRLNFEEVVVVRKPGYSSDGVAAVLTSPPYAETTVSDLNASPLNGPIGNASRRKDNRKGGSEADLGFGGKGYTREGA